VHRRCGLLIVAFTLLIAARASAQDDVLARAGEAARTGHRAEALMMLEAHLAQAPEDAEDAGRRRDRSR